MTRLLATGLIFALLLGLPGFSARGALPTAPTLPVKLSAQSSCGYSDTVADLLAQVDLTQWSGWVRKLSGADPVTVRGQTMTITTRYSQYLFDGTSPAYDFVKEQISQWYSTTQIEEHTYQPYGSTSQTWNNLVLTIPGSTRPRSVVILTAHIDSIAIPNNSAPGADDNATGVATLLEAARVLQENPLPDTVRLIWFTGEEQWLKGSTAYVQDHPLIGVIGVINVDMFGYDGDNDRCFELHVGTLPSSNLVGSCFVETIGAYNLDLNYDYIDTTSATQASDHASFWGRGIGAVEVLENFQNNNISTGCGPRDWNPYYHTASDTIDKLNLPYSFDVARAALAATFSLAMLPFELINIPIIGR